MNDVEEIRLRKPDEDLKSYLEYNTDIFTIDDVYNIHAEIAEHNDEDNWYWILELRDKRIILTSAWCDYTGWDCQSGGESKVAENVEAAVMLAPEKEEYTNREPRRNLLAQVRGELPFGLEDVRN